MSFTILTPDIIVVNLLRKKEKVSYGDLLHIKVLIMNKVSKQDLYVDIAPDALHKYVYNNYSMFSRSDKDIVRAFDSDNLYTTKQIEEKFNKKIPIKIKKILLKIIEKF